MLLSLFGAQRPRALRSDQIGDVLAKPRAVRPLHTEGKVLRKNGSQDKGRRYPHNAGPGAGLQDVQRSDEHGREGEKNQNQIPRREGRNPYRSVAAITN